MHRHLVRSTIIRAGLALGLSTLIVAGDLSAVVPGATSTPKAGAIDYCDLYPDPKPLACEKDVNVGLLDWVELAGWSVERQLPDPMPHHEIANPAFPIRLVAYTDVVGIFPSVTAGPSAICGVLATADLDSGLGRVFTVELRDIGDCIITATAVQPAVPSDRTQTISRTVVGYRVPQTLTWQAPLDRYYAPLALVDVTATSSAGFPVAYSVTGPCIQVTGINPALEYPLVKAVSDGTCTVTAIAAGSATHLAAEPVSRSFVIATVAPDLAWASDAGPPTIMEFPHAGTYEIVAISWTDVLALSATGACTVATTGVRAVNLRYFEIVGSVTTTGTGECTLSASVTQFVLDLVRGRSVSPHSISGMVPVVAAAETVVDTTPPTVTASVIGTLGADGWYTGDVDMSWTVGDAESAVSSQTACAPTTVTTDTAGLTLTCTANSAGGTTTESVTVKRDATAPTLAPVVTPNPVVFGQSASAAANAADALSGLATSSCGTAASSTTVGNQSVTCAATDNAGNTASASASYQVQWAWRGFVGFSQPPTMNRYVAGLPVPLLFSLGANLGLAILAGSPTSQRVDCTTRAAIGGATNVDPRSALFYERHTSTYAYVWRTDRAWRGTCRVFTLRLADNTVRSVAFTFR